MSRSKNYQKSIMQLLNSIQLKNYLYIIIPILCFSFWSLSVIFYTNFNIHNAFDFPAIYYAGKYIFTHPEFVYSDKIYPPYPYAPAFATVFAPVSLFPYIIAAWIYFFILYTFGILIILEFNRILILKKVETKFIRFLFLIVISNGYNIFKMFEILQTKLIVAYFLLFLLRREIQYREIHKDLFNFKFFFTQCLILSFAVSLVPQYVFFFLIYILNNVNYKELFKYNQLKKYLLLVLAIIIENFMLFIMIIISPSTLMNFIQGSYRGNRRVVSNLTHSTIVKDNIILPIESLTSFLNVLNLYINVTFMSNFITGISLILMIVVTMILIFKDNLLLEQKFGYFALISLFLYTFYYLHYLVMLLPLVILLFIETLSMEEKFVIFIKKNYFFFIGLISISTLYFMPPLYILLNLMRILFIIPLAILFLSWTICYILISISLYYLNKNKKNLSNNGIPIEI